MIELLTITSGALGIHLLWSALAMGHPGFGHSPMQGARQTQRSWMARTGLAAMRERDILGTSVAVGFGVGLGAWIIFGGVMITVFAALGGSCAPVLAKRSRRRRHLSEAQHAWPRIIDDIRVMSGGMGKSLPDALFSAAERAPEALASGFVRARREWLLTTDFSRALLALKSDIAHPTADLVCETLTVAHEVGGVDLDRRLRDLAGNRLDDAQARQDARARQAGARFARSFVLLVPIGMALVGLSIGRGRTAYSTTPAQVLVLTGLAIIGGCWVWASHLMATPSEQRVFAE